MPEGLYFRIKPKSRDVSSVILGKELGGYQIFAEDREGEKIWRFDVQQDRLDHILADLSGLIDADSRWEECDGASSLTCWDALVRLAAFDPVSD